MKRLLREQGKSPVKIIIPLILISFSVFFFSGCETNSSTIDDLRQVCFETEVLPIFQNSCATTNCHDVTAREGYRFDSYNGIMRGVVAGDASKSKVYRAISSTGFLRMPPSGPLSQEARMIIRTWIEQGAFETTCIDTSGFIPDTTGKDTLQNGWSNPYACFERDILPIMISSCGTTGCHDPLTQREGYNFTTYAGILKGLSPGNPNSSKIIEAVTRPEDDDIMPPPPRSRLTQTQIDTIYNWIARGALNEDCGDLCDTTDVTYTTQIESIISLSCTGCHSGTTAQKGVHLESYNDLVTAVNSGAVPAVLTGSNGYSQMPPGSSLSDCNITLITKWIENGMPE